jgi:hypothetical protein
VLATGGTLMNATNSSVPIRVDCFQDAWDYGTNLGGSEYAQWFYMNEYYETNCV